MTGGRLRTAHGAAAPLVREASLKGTQTADPTSTRRSYHRVSVSWKVRFMLFALPSCTSDCFFRRQGHLVLEEG